MERQSSERLNDLERAALARSIKTHGVVAVLNEVNNLVKSGSTNIAILDCIKQINGNVNKRKAQRQISASSPVLQ